LLLLFIVRFLEHPAGNPDSVGGENDKLEITVADGHVLSLVGGGELDPDGLNYRFVSRVVLVGQRV
jgi:hypothetical protein